MDCVWKKCKDSVVIKKKLNGLCLKKDGLCLKKI